MSAIVSIIFSILLLIFGLCARSVMRTETRNLNMWEVFPAWCVHTERNKERHRKRRNPLWYATMKYFVDGQEKQIIVGTFTELSVGQKYDMIRHRKNGCIQMAFDKQISKGAQSVGTICVYVALAIIAISIFRMVSAGQVF